MLTLATNYLQDIEHKEARVELMEIDIPAYI